MGENLDLRTKWVQLLDWNSLAVELFSRNFLGSSMHDLVVEKSSMLISKASKNIGHCSSNETSMSRLFQSHDG